MRKEAELGFTRAAPIFGSAPRGAARAAGRRRAGRLRELMVAGLVDSFGLSLGWTLFNLVAVARGGLAEAALFNAAMLLGIVLSAPVTTWLARRLHGRGLLAGAAATEAALRVGTLLALIAGWPGPVVAGGVTVMYVCAFAGFAAMRAEVAAVDGRPRAMTRYGMSIAAMEAGGAALAALLPRDSLGTLLPFIMLVYGLSLVPTIFTAKRARVENATAPAVVASAKTVKLPVGVLAGGAAVALFGYGPTLLSVALATELHGQSSVVGAAIAFSAGCLLSSVAVDAVGRLRLPATLAWPLWGVGMVAGWALAPWSLAGLCAAQLLSGISLTAFEGAMDARVAAEADPATVTTAMAWTAATRAMGGAVAVRVLPLLVAAPAIGAVAGGGGSALATGAVAATLLAATLGPGRHRATRLARASR
jgi:hypothetical protein